MLSLHYQATQLTFGRWILWYSSAFTDLTKVVECALCVWIGSHELCVCEKVSCWEPWASGAEPESSVCQSCGISVASDEAPAHWCCHGYWCSDSCCHWTYLQHCWCWYAHKSSVDCNSQLVKDMIELRFLWFFKLQSYYFTLGSVYLFIILSERV